METSDSEYFESADEDFQSDDEEQSSVKLAKKPTENKEIIHVDDKKNANTTELITNSIEPNANTNTEKELDNEKSLLTAEIITKTSNIEIDQREEKQKSQKVTSQPVLPQKEETKSVPEKKPVEEKNDENLWDDDEIDWGKEEHQEEKKERGKEQHHEDKKEGGKEQHEEEPSMWDNDDWEPIENNQVPISTKPEPEKKSFSTPQHEKVQQDSGSNNWGSWGSWGVSSILSTATQGVSTLTQGISTVLESGMGVPDPEELARINRAEKEKIKQLNLEHDLPGESSEKNSSFGLGNFVSGVSHLTKLVETTSTKVISGGLDTLETIGKKTMEVLQEGDPGLKKKRAFLSIDQDKPVLSQLLREAKEKAESENRVLEQQHFTKKAKNYETLFDDHQGLVHLEALEMLSRQCDIKLETILESHTDDALTEMQETLEQVKELCELPDEDEDEQANLSEIKEKLEAAVTEINIPITYKRLIETWEETETWLNTLNLDICNEHELHQSSIDTLARLTAIAVEQFHKSGELLLVKEHRSTADEADSLVQLTTTLTSLIGVVAAKFSDKLNAKSSKSKNNTEINELITNVFFEAANSSSYIQDAFQLLVPVLQVGAV